MSGGHFDYIQFRMRDTIRKLQHVCNNFSDFYIENQEVKEKFLEGLTYLKMSEIFLHRIDWLVSADDGEEIFLERLKDDLASKYLSIEEEEYEE